jgi:hypothetical protein
MTNFRDFVLSIAITSVLIAAGWYSCSYSQGSVDPALTSDLAQALLPRVGLNASESETDYFADYSRARLLTSHKHYDSFNPQSATPDSLIEIHQVPLVSHANVQMSQKNNTQPRPFDHILLAVERARYEGLLDATVLGAYRTHTGSSDVIPAAIVEIKGTKKVYIVTAMKTTDGLELRILSHSRGSSTSDTWERRTANPSMKCSDSLEPVASTRIRIPGFRGEVADFSATTVAKHDGPHLDIHIRGSSIERGDVLCEQSYSLKSNTWSSIPASPIDSSEQYDANAPWKLETASTKICAMLPVNEHLQGNPKTNSMCVALVKQSYRYLPSTHGSGGAFWIVECSPDGNLKDAVPFGVIYPECPLFGPGGGFCDFSATLIYQPELDRCFVVTSGYSKSGCGLFVHRCSLAKPLAGQGLELTADPKRWPAQMEQVSELPMYLLKHETSIESASISSKTSDEDASLIVTMKPDNNWGESWQETCRYNFRTRQWTTTKQKVDVRAGVH